MATQMTTESTNTHDQAEIRQLIVDRQSAICAKDVDRIMAYYTTDVIYFESPATF
jgi:ketosteroid isomerase-like protein